MVFHFNLMLLNVFISKLIQCSSIISCFFDLVASAHVHPPHTDMQRHNINARGVKLSPGGYEGSLRLVVY